MRDLYSRDLVIAIQCHWVVTVVYDGRVGVTVQCTVVEGGVADAVMILQPSFEGWHECELGGGGRTVVELVIIQTDTCLNPWSDGCGERGVSEGT